MSLRDATPARIANDASLPWRRPPARRVGRGFVGAALASLASLVGLAAGAGCGSSDAPHGPPVLQTVYWQVKGQQCVVWSTVPDAGTLLPAVPGAPSQFNLVFDRVIDGSKIEDTVTVNGVSRQQPKAMPPVSVTWPDMTATTPGSPPYSLSVWYNSVHLPVAAGNTSYVYGREAPSFPSDTTLAIHIDPNGITSKYNEPMASMDPIPVTTQPFALTINPAPPDPSDPESNCKPQMPVPLPSRVATDYRLPLLFNNVPADTAVELPKHIEVRQNGTVLGAGEYQLVVDPLDATRIFLQPGTIRIWDSGAVVDVAIAADLPDVFGKPLGVPQSATFNPCEPIGSDGGVPICASPMPRDTTDGGADAGADTGAAGDASADLGGDADASADGDAGGDDVAVDAGVDAAPAD